MSLSKVPIIILLTFGFKKMLTPPHPPPSSDEAVPSTKIDIHGSRRYRFALGHLVQILVGAAEVIAIVGPRLPASPLLQKVLSLATLRSARPLNLRLNAISALGAALWIFGAALRLRTYQALGSFFRYEISIQKDHRLITTGPYSIVRHPSYSGLVLANIGWFLWNFADGSWVRETGVLGQRGGVLLLATYISAVILPTSLITLSRMSREDAALRKKFGVEWDRWASRVPYSVFPGIY
ncbi:hypothetical protein CPC08DRAFT_715022 [Agrocybe pediades]|nr:hypothetical protein CPC08DRAFT_715022 [Agrocybe pediades]